MGDAAQGEYRDLDGAASLAELLETEAEVVIGFGEGLEDGAEKGVVGAFGFGLAEFVERVAGDADEETGRGGEPETTRGGAVGGQVDAVRPGGEGDIEAAIDDDLLAGRLQERLAGEGVKLAGREMLGAQLEPIGPRVGRGMFGDLAVEERVHEQLGANTNPKQL